MNIYLALCGNRYSESLASLCLLGNETLLIHRSNAPTLAAKARRLTTFVVAFALRWLVIPLVGGRFRLCIPHTAGNYGRISRLLQPHEYIVIDDGITFEYWSNFHNKHISPLLQNPGTKLLIGPRSPNWDTELWKHIETRVIPRNSVVEKLLDTHSIISPRTWATPDSKATSNSSRRLTGWILDDGGLDALSINHIEQLVRERFKCTDVIVLWHPSRGLDKDNHPRPPAEVAILDTGMCSGVVVGRASTALFNIAATNNGIVVASLPSGHIDLDASAIDQGILSLEIANNVNS